jgi:hypothetical protein
MDRAVFVYTTFPSLVEAEAAARVIVGQGLGHNEAGRGLAGPVLQGMPFPLCGGQ